MISYLWDSVGHSYEYMDSTKNKKVVVPRGKNDKKENAGNSTEDHDHEEDDGFPQIRSNRGLASLIVYRYRVL